MAKKKSKRVKSDKNFIPIADWGVADGYVRKVGELQLKINSAIEAANDDINDRKLELAKETKPLNDRIKLLTASLEAFCAGNKKDFGKKQSKKITFGLLGWRKSSSIKVSTKRTLELLRNVFKTKAKQYLHVKVTVNKEALVKLTDEQLASVAAQRKHKEVFFVEPDIPEAIDYVE